MQISFSISVHSFLHGVGLILLCSLMLLNIELVILVAENNSCWMHWNTEQSNDNADNRPTLLLAQIRTPKD